MRAKSQVQPSMELLTNTSSASDSPARQRLSMGQRLQHAIDRGYRELIDELDSAQVMKNLCVRVSQATGAVLVCLVHVRDDGAFHVEAASAENALWAELGRIPERADGTIAGNGPSARALQRQAPAVLSVDDDGFIPWRDAARRERVESACAYPLRVESQDWTLVLYLGGQGARSSEDRSLSDQRALALECERLLEAMSVQHRRRLLYAALMGCGNAAFIADTDGKIEWANAAFTRVTGYSAEEVQGKNPRILSSGRNGVRYYRELWNTIRTGKVWHGETVDQDRHGKRFTVAQTISPFGVGDRVTHYLAIYEEISRQKREQDRRRILNPIDPLSRMWHVAALEHAIDAALGHKQPVRIALLALSDVARLGAADSAPMISFGEQVRARILDCADAQRVAELSDWEYVLWLPDDEIAAAKLLAALHRSLLEPYPLIGAVPGLVLQVGQAQSPQDGESFNALRLKADRRVGVEPLMPARRHIHR